jgi:hypothetical protein
MPGQLPSRRGDRQVAQVPGRPPGTCRGISASNPMAPGPAGRRPDVPRSILAHTTRLTPPREGGGPTDPHGSAL